MVFISSCFIFSIVYQALFHQSFASTHYSKYVIPQSDGTLKYVPYNSEGDTIPDFSWVGYRHGDVDIPVVETVKTVNPNGKGASDVANIQKAINDMAALPIGTDGFRGAILLGPGEFVIDSTIYLNISGVVIRGSGTDKTVLYGSAKFAYDLIQVGFSNVASRYFGSIYQIKGYVKVRSTEIPLANAKTLLKPGDVVAIYAKKNELWINTTGMNMLNYYAPASSKDTVNNWEPFNSRHDRTVVEVNSDSFIIDVPLDEAIDPLYGGGSLQKFTVDNWIRNVGVEDLCSYSYYDPSVTLTISSKNTTSYFADENHASRLVTFYGTIDGFAQRLCGRYFNHFVSVRKFSKRVTVKNASHTDPISKLDGERRYTFHLHQASEVLFENCYSSGARHAFIFNSRTTGPNVFYNCKSEKDYAKAEPHDRWSVAGLYDNVHGTVSIQNRLYYGTGHGWGGGNFVAWNTEGDLQLHSPATDWNFAIGHVGKMVPPDFYYAVGGVDRSWENHGVHVEPKSLFLAQRADRLLKKRV